VSTGQPMCSNTQQTLENENEHLQSYRCVSLPSPANAPLATNVIRLLLRSLYHSPHQYSVKPQNTCTAPHSDVKLPSPAKDPLPIDVMLLTPRSLITKMCENKRKRHHHRACATAYQLPEYSALLHAGTLTNPWLAHSGKHAGQSSERLVDPVVLVAVLVRVLVDVGAAVQHKPSSTMPTSRAHYSIIPFTILMIPVIALWN
jgi:hypothetical protein